MERRERKSTRRYSNTVTGVGSSQGVHVTKPSLMRSTSALVIGLKID